LVTGKYLRHRKWYCVGSSWPWSRFITLALWALALALWTTALALVLIPMALGALALTPSLVYTVRSVGISAQSCWWSSPWSTSLVLSIIYYLLSVECKKTIEVSAARDHEQELYCKTCHGRLFGPKGYGFAGGAGTMLSMDTGKEGDVATRLVNLTCDVNSGNIFPNTPTCTWYRRHQGR